MYTINIRGKQNPKDTKMALLEIIFQDRYACVPKVIKHHRAIKRLGCQVSEFPCRECGGYYQEQTVFDLRTKYLRKGRHVADTWEMEGRELVARPAITLLR